MWQKVLFKKIGVLFLASMVFGGSLWANDELFNKIDALIYVSKNPNIIERNKKTIAIAGQINSILSARYDVLLSQSEDAIVALNGQINTYKNNKDMLKYLKTAKATEESNYYNVRKLSTKFKAVKAFGAVGNALNVYDLIKTSNEAYVNIQEGKANYKNTFLPIAEKIISFNPVAGGLVHIKNEIDTGMTLSRGVGEEYSNEIYNIRDRYFKQYHILANKGIEGKNPEKMIELFKQQRKGMRVELDDLLKELNTGTMAWLPVFGKDKARDELIKIRYGILGEDKEKRIIEKQNNIYNKMYKHYENNVIIKNKSSDIEKLNTNVSTHISEKLKEIDTPIVNNEKKEQPSVNKQKEAKIDLDKKKSEADNLRAENAKLASEYEALYKQSKANPNDKTLKAQLESKDKELRKNAQAFIELRTEIQKDDPSYVSYVDGPITIKKRVDGNLEPIKEDIDNQKKVNLDPNKEKLAKLKSTDKELKSKIKSINDKQSQLKSKKDELANINRNIRNAYQRAQNAEKGSDEYNYAINNWKSFAWQKHYILIEINALISSIGDFQILINNLEREQNYQMNQIVDTVDDYLNDSKTKIATTTRQSNDNTYTWRGFITKNIETKSDGTLRYWGGNFDPNIINYDVGPLFQNDSADKNKIVSVRFSDGTNANTDNTNIIQILNSEIDTGAPGYNTNIKTLNLTKNMTSGETLNVKRTGNYNYVVWGSWEQTGGFITNINGGNGIEHKAMHNNWIAGEPTQNLPTQGSATYNGMVKGQYYTNSVGSNYGGAIKGTMAMTVNFANPSIVSGTLNLKKADNSTFLTATMNSMQISTSNKVFAGRLVGANVAPNQTSNNQINGQFYGPNAEEVGGNWTVDKTSGELAQGVFAGQR